MVERRRRFCFARDASLGELRAVMAALHESPADATLWLRLSTSTTSMQFSRPGSGGIESTKFQLSRPRGGWMPPAF
jgi:hypothetical protein